MKDGRDNQEIRIVRKSCIIARSWIIKNRTNQGNQENHDIQANQSRQSLRIKIIKVDANKARKTSGYS